MLYFPHAGLWVQSLKLPYSDGLDLCVVVCHAGELCSVVYCSVLQCNTCATNMAMGHEFKLSEASDFNKFPLWCIQDPVVDSFMVSEIKQTWNNLKTGHTHGYRRMLARVRQGGDAAAFAAADGMTGTNVDAAGSHQSGGLAVEGDEPDLAMASEDEEHGSAIEGTGDLVLRSFEGPSHYQNASKNKKSQAGETSVAKRDDQGPRISPTQFFYDNFYLHLFSLNPRYRLMFSDNIARQGKMLAQLVGFIVHSADQLDTHEFNKTAYNLAKVHNKRGIRPEDYDTLGQALLMAIKASLGHDYTDRVKVAWTTVFSALLIAVLPFVESAPTVYIRRAKWNPALCAAPSVKKSPIQSPFPDVTPPYTQKKKSGCTIM
eukprot:g61579.t1